RHLSLFYWLVHPLALHSFPTRRSSDLFLIIDKFVNILGDFLHRLNKFGLTGIASSHAFHECSEIYMIGNGHRLIPPRVFKTMAVDRKSTRLNSSHVKISYAVFCLKKKR